MPNKIMAIAAHPGDALFSMGAAVAQHIHGGGAGVFLNLSLGERGHPSIGPDEYGAMQRCATEEAANILGAETAFFPYRDAEIPFTEPASVALADAVREHRPDIVITHWNGSWHKDHRNTFLLVRDALFYAELSSLDRELPAHKVEKLFFAENWEDAASYDPDIFLDIAPVYENWIKACSAFPMWRGETGLIRYHDYYRSLAVMRGCLSGFQYAVALMSGPGQRTRYLTNL